MFSFAWTLECVGYDKLIRDAFAEPSEPLRSISGTIAILFVDLGVCGVVEVRSLDEWVRSRSRSPRGRS